jgi:hypothetical protein
VDVAGLVAATDPPEREEKEMPAHPSIREESLAFLSADVAADRWQQFGADPDVRMDELLEAISRRAGRSARELSGATGIEFHTGFQRPMMAPDARTNVAVIDMTMLVADLGGAPGERVGIIGSSTATAPAAGVATTSPTRAVRVLFQQGGGWDTAAEWRLDDARQDDDARPELVAADGIWDAFRGCIRGCSGPCLAALPGCLAMAATLGGAVVCLAAACGACAARCAACALCDCGILCRWAVGCCNQ